MGKVIVIVIDGFGVGAASDASEFDSSGANTISSVFKAADARGIVYENLLNLGLGSYVGGELGCGDSWTLTPDAAGCDTPSGHWEMMGCVTAVAPPVYPEGFNESLLQELAKACAIPGWLGNEVIDGMGALSAWGAQHLETGKPIIYTSADSVMQVAAHEEVFGLQRLWDVCATLRHELDERAKGSAAVGRIIARPFTGEAEFTRTNNRRDWAVPPPRQTALDVLQEVGIPTIGIGKIGDIFAHRGLSEELHPDGDAACLGATIEAIDVMHSGLIFTNLVEFDSRFGHRRDPSGYAKHLAWLDKELPNLIETMNKDDRLVLTADHGNDPSYSGFNHTRENVPALCYAPNKNKGSRAGASMSSLGGAVCEYFGIQTESLDTPERKMFL